MKTQCRHHDFENTSYVLTPYGADRQLVLTIAEKLDMTPERVVKECFLRGLDNMTQTCKEVL